jgi:hypothetical protein
MAVGGFPFSFRVRLEKPLLGQTRDAPGWEASLPVLVGEAPPWSPHRWRLTAEQGGRLRVAPSETRGQMMLLIAKLDGSVAQVDPGDPPGTSVRLHGSDIRVDGDEKLRIGAAELAGILPAASTADHKSVWTRGTVRLSELHLPSRVGPLGDTVAAAEAQLAVKGAIPKGPRRAALAAWRDAGGTLEVERLHVSWGALSGNADGTLALDEAMQPMGAGTATIEGYGAIVDALVAEGTMKPGDALLARLALGVLAKPGPNGDSQLQAAITLQQSVLTIAQFKVARLPHFTWD